MSEGRPGWDGLAVIEREGIERSRLLLLSAALGGITGTSAAGSAAAAAACGTLVAALDLDGRGLALFDRDAGAGENLLVAVAHAHHVVTDGDILHGELSVLVGGRGGNRVRRLPQLKRNRIGPQSRLSRRPGATAALSWLHQAHLDTLDRLGVLVRHRAGDAA